MIRKAERRDAAAAAALMGALWPAHDRAELLAEAAETVSDPDGAVFLAEEDGRAVGFAQCSLRRDYVEGSDGGPVGYLEGLYVVPERRRRGVALALERACEDWARARGCREMGSDCELSNALSPLFHAGAGFEEANRIICFLKQL